ncbi:uncharacterized protein LOC121786732 [Salvia splendens]|uniref:uncharacterized protein LOC121786732 n=1 Tax=Salvia splendens TaxID=180675 RepID=UPI001C276CF5|nr:uncharacterized protein LOC121786732 [Salvia splendens]
MQLFISVCLFFFSSSSWVDSKSIPTVSADELYSTLSFFTSYYTGEEALIGKSPNNTRYYNFVRKSARLQIQDHRKTNDSCVYRVRGYLLVQFPYWYGGTDHSRAQGMIRFWLDGLWSDKSRHLMMVGSASWVVDGNPIILDAVLDTAKANPTLFNSYISGGLSSTVCAPPGYFDPLSIFSFPQLASYNYSLLSRVCHEADMFSGAGHDQCWVFTGEKIVLEVDNGSFLRFTPIQCSPLQRKMRYIATFQNTTYGQDFGLNSSVIGEAFWDNDKRELLGVACRLLDPLNRSADEKADCRMRLSLSYTSVFTIINEPKLVGWYWSTRHIHDSSYFGSVNLTKSDGFGIITLPEVRYVYTKLGQVRRSSCAAKRVGRTHILIKCNLICLYIIQEANKSHGQLKYGSLFTSLNWSMNANDQVEIRAEGVYDAETGCLCMVGCRNSDCEILVTLEFSQAKGSIKSTRAKTDPLYFHDMTMQSVIYYMEEGARTTWRIIDLETAMVLVSNALTCVFVALQINHVKRYPKVASSISVLMLVILSVGQWLRLVLSMEGDVHRGRAEADLAEVRLSSLVALLMQLRLVQLVWEREVNGNRERRAGCALLMLYVAGGLLAFVMNGRGSSSSSKYFSVCVERFKELWWCDC